MLTLLVLLYQPSKTYPLFAVAVTVFCGMIIPIEVYVPPPVTVPPSAGSAWTFKVQVIVSVPAA